MVLMHVFPQFQYLFVHCQLSQSVFPSSLSSTRPIHTNPNFLSVHSLLIHLLRLSVSHTLPTASPNSTTSLHSSSDAAITTSGQETTPSGSEHFSTALSHVPPTEPSTIDANKTSKPDPTQNWSICLHRATKTSHSTTVCPERYGAKYSS
ncbi:hypothetical protein BLNAU_14318 [Blattamonas nauphoetae]|uniref:Uncharacterized protein n=1 Tax=Blattamonas nauphoetae TaxID=2049346 RepID=A0ABQ9XH97_9EUKA|nr:hypothetical protein BLNAU_24441 [Blattamonas nauphoetae]KAK2950789.1 hypothetical protein BLNAU_14318 [Blattamonas nauphoetae]